MTIPWAILGAMLGGVSFAVSISANHRLRQFIVSPLAANLINFTGGFLLLLTLFLVGISRLPELHLLSNQPGWIFLGGAIGSMSATFGLIAIPRLGLAISLVVSTLGQLIMSMLIDWAGLFGVTHQPVHLFRILGVLCLLAAVLLTQVVERPTRQQH
jgi:bacterial/archaeal transporter family-2 protein